MYWLAFHASDQQSAVHTEHLPGHESGALACQQRVMTAHQIAERLDYYGSYYDVNIDRDYAHVPMIWSGCRGYHAVS